MVKAALMFTKSGDNFNFQLKISLASESGIRNLIILSSQLSPEEVLPQLPLWRKLGPRWSYHRLYEAARMFMFPHKNLEIHKFHQISWLCEAVLGLFPKLWHPAVPWIKYGNLFAPKARNISLRHMFPAAICLWYLWQFGALLRTTIDLGSAHALHNLGCFHAWEHHTVNRHESNMNQYLAWNSKMQYTVQPIKTCQVTANHLPNKNNNWNVFKSFNLRRTQA